MSTHAQLLGEELHDAYQYVQETDPGAVGAGKNWLKVSTGSLKRRNVGNSGWDTTGVSNFIDLRDAPSSYTGQAGKFLRVVVGEDGLEFATGGGGISFVTAPTTETSTGATGDSAYDLNGFYICTTTNFWKYAPLQHFPGARGTYTYSSDGDTNGVFYALGSYIGGGSWVNPYTAGLVGIVAPTGLFSTNSYITIVDRASNNSATNDVANSSFIFDLGIGRSLVMSKYSYRAWTSGNNLPTAFVIQGSNDAVNWTTLDTQTGLSLSAAQWLSATVTNMTPWRYFQMKNIATDSSGNNYLTIGEMEFYGILK